MKPVDGKICSLNTRTSTRTLWQLSGKQAFSIAGLYFSVSVSQSWMELWARLDLVLCVTYCSWLCSIFLFVSYFSYNSWFPLSLSLSSAAGVQPHKYSCRNLPVSASTVWSHGVRGRCVKGRPSFYNPSLLLFCVLCKSPVVVDQSDITYQYFHLPSASSLLSFHRSNSQFSLFLCLSPG